MFTKGQRFKALKPSDIPGPGHYDPKDPDFAQYKRGGFLEKADRFDENAATVGPGPNAYLAHEAGPSRAPPPPSIKLQMEALRLRLEKEHAKELQQLEARATRAELKAQELAKEKVTLQGNVTSAQKESRLALQREKTLRASTEKNEAIVKHHQERAGNYAALQKKLENLETLHAESKRKQALQIDQLQYDLAAQLKLSTEQDAELVALRTTSKEESHRHEKDTRRYKDHAEQLQRDLATERTLVSNQQSELYTLRSTIGSSKTSYTQLEAALREETAQRLALETRLRDSDESSATQTLSLRSEIFALTQQLDSLRVEHTNSVRTIATQYAHLASTSVSRTSYQRLRHQNARFELRLAHLERRLGDRAAQVTEVAHYARNVEEKNAFLTRLLDDAEHEVKSLRARLADQDQERDPASREILELRGVANSIENAMRSQYDKERIVIEASETAIRTHTRALFDNTWSELVQLAAYLPAYEHYASSLESLMQDHQSEMSELRERDAEWATRTANAEGEPATIHTDHAIRTKALQETLVRAQMAESGLQDDIATLESSLNDAMQYEEAYRELLQHVQVLVSRNALAEDEATRLGAFNARILGHANVNQRIYYVDRLRKEMSEVKQKLLNAEWERNAVREENVALQHEVDTYKSIDAPKLKVAPLTRVGRLPLSMRSTNSSAARTDGRLSVTDLAK